MMSAHLALISLWLNFLYDEKDLQTGRLTRYIDVIVVGNCLMLDLVRTGIQYFFRTVVCVLKCLANSKKVMRLSGCSNPQKIWHDESVTFRINFPNWYSLFLARLIGNKCRSSYIVVVYGALQLRQSCNSLIAWPSSWNNILELRPY